MTAAGTPASECALFPLGTVLFPEGPLALRIFEPRYLELVSECLREQREFGVCLITQGREAGAAARTVALGTSARIVDWHRYDDGLLGISCTGGTRFRVLATRVQADQLVRARIQPLEPEPACAVPGRHAGMVTLLHALIERNGPLYATVTPRYEDATWVGYRLAEMLPLPAVFRQEMLALDDAVQRLDRLDEAIRGLQSVATSPER